jgi:DNA-binding XRE family transcriptional regulator
MANFGRPSRFTDPVRDTCLRLAEEGKTNEEIAKAIGVSKKTFYLWKQNNGDFRDAIKERMDVATELVEIALFEKAVGYTRPAVKLFMHEGQVIEHHYIEHYAPCTTAQIFFLKNRKRDVWAVSDKLEVTAKPSLVITRPDGTVVELGMAEVDEEK